MTYLQELETQLAPNRPTTAQALLGVLIRHLAKPGVDLPELINRVNKELDASRMSAPTRSVVLEDIPLHLNPEFERGYGVQTYEAQNKGRSFIKDFPRALAAWLTALYTMADEPSISFEVEGFSYSACNIKVFVDYLPPEGKEPPAP